MKYTIEITHNKGPESKGTTVTFIKDASGNPVDYSTILLSLNPKMSLQWDDYRHSSLNPNRFVGSISFPDAFENARTLRLSIESYTKRLVSYFIDLDMIITSVIGMEL